MHTTSTPHALAESLAPKVAILMGTYNGAQFLEAQLASIAAQTYSNWELHISDDGSTDHTLSIADDIRRAPNQRPIYIRKGPQRGFVSNFLHLACSQDIQANYYAFADQDDVWDCNRLAHALTWLRSVPEELPALFCSRTRLIDHRGDVLGYSPLFERKPSFHNALVQSIAGANTMIFNDAARQLLIAAGPAMLVASHDWWLYMLTTGCGGIVRYDPKPLIDYRQHEANLVGSNIGLRARYVRLIALFNGRFTHWNNINTKALDKISPLLTPTHRLALKSLSDIRSKKSCVERATGILNSGLYRQTPAGNFSLFLGAFLGKL